MADAKLHCLLNGKVHVIRFAYALDKFDLQCGLSVGIVDLDDLYRRTLPICMAEDRECFFLFGSVEGKKPLPRLQTEDVDKVMTGLPSEGECLPLG